MDTKSFLLKVTARSQAEFWYFSRKTLSLWFFAEMSLKI